MTARDDRASHRLPAIDVVRGLVMVLMTLDHASAAFNAGRLMADGAATFPLDMVFEPAQFVTRWVAHLCAPTFVFLAGVSLALSTARRPMAGVDRSLIDRDILIRGALLVGLDALWMSWIWRLGQPLQIGVLYAIGVSMIGMIALRRLPAAVVGGLGLVVLVGGEAVTSLLGLPLVPPLVPTTGLAAATMTGGQVGSIFYLYPFLPWAGVLLVGWAVGMRIVGGGAAASPGMRARDWLALAAIAAVVFAVVRGLNGYGNADVLRRDGSWPSWMEWLHVSKYPPSLTFAALELGLAFALLAAAWWRYPGPTRTGPPRSRPQENDVPRGPAPWNPLLVFGQTALFFYLLHVHVLKGVAFALGVHRALGLGVTYLAWLAMLVILYPACRWYLGLKRRHPDSVLRFV